ncbi:TniQ family protein [Paludibacterium paludis]|uniref:TniQ family protein n=1 Tax=Paludibacterium paludis TaxID=1225769 RepID=UPI001674FEE4|nr:TniQ family protein [Paludibacterium paludis]
MLSGQRWPAHPHPLPDELLSCWLVRTAHANGLKVQTFCQHEFGAHYQIWNRDIDRGAPTWLLNLVSLRTGQDEERVLATTLQTLLGTVFRQQSQSGQLRWILPLNIYHRTRLGHGLQFCPLCLATANEPYYHRAWRVAFHTFCPIHGVMLLDRCPACGKGVAFHRTDLGHPDQEAFAALNICSHCAFDLTRAQTDPVDQWNREIFTSWQHALELLSSPIPHALQQMSDRLAILHHFCALCVSQRLALKLHPYLCAQTGHPLPELTTGMPTFEQRPISERHHIIGLAWWLIHHWPHRLKAAHRDKAVRYNVLFKDFDDCPDWYIESIRTMTNTTCS